MSSSRFIALLLVLGTLAIYLPAAHYGFTLYDDPDYVFENSMVQDGLTWAGIKWALTTLHASNWHPLTWLSHMLDCQLFGLNAGMHHVVNVLFHTANAVLLFVLLRRWLALHSGASARQAGPEADDASASQAFWASAVVAALFAWHPLHVESVAWISERKDVLSTFFALLALLAYTRHVNKQSRVEGRGSKAARALDPRLWSLDYYLALLFFALGLMAKPMLVTLPFVMLLLDYWPLQRFQGDNVQGSRFKVQQLLVEKIPFFLLVGGSCVLTFLAQRYGGAVVSLKIVPLYFRFENAPVAAVRYLLKILWPGHLSIFYPLAKIPVPTLTGALAVLIVISLAAWRWRKGHPYFIVGWLWFLGTLVPVIGLVQVGSAAIADRYTYFSSIGIFFAGVLGLQAVARRFHFQRMTAVTAVLALGACLFLTYRQLNYWRNDIALFSHAVAVTKNNATAHLNLGYAYWQHGQKNEALEEYRATIKLDPDNVQARNNLANSLDQAGRVEEASKEYEAALRLDPNFVPAHNNFGILLADIGRYDDAIKQYTESMRLDSKDWHAPFLMGKVYLRQNRDAEAISWFKNALQLAPNNLTVLAYLAQVLASDQDPKVRDGHAAYLMAFKANTLSDGFQPSILDALGMAYAELGRFDDAQKATEDALSVCKQINATNDVPAIQRRLDLYKNNQPFRQSFTNAPARELPKE